MTQKEVDSVFAIAMTVHEHPYFSDNSDRQIRISTDTLIEWTALQLAQSLKIYTVPCGSSVCLLTNESIFKLHWGRVATLDAMREFTGSRTKEHQ